MSSQPVADTGDTLRVVPLHRSIGARVEGIDLGQPLGAESADALRAAWMKHLVLVFKGQDITDTELVAFTRHFGEPEVFHQDIIKSQRVPEIFRVANVDENDELLPASDLTVQQLTSAESWHTDSSYREAPSIATLLYGREVTKRGGQTRFCNMYDVYDALPADTKRRIEGRRALHDFGYLRTAKNLPPVSAEDAAKMPPVWQPLVRRHPVTGRRALYLSIIYNYQVEGLSREESEALLAELNGYCDNEDFIYEHHWTNGDVIMWDNRCTVHQRRPFATGERRILHRTTIVGDGPVIAG